MHIALVHEGDGEWTRGEDEGIEEEELDGGRIVWVAGLKINSSSTR
jgi:hypothetical protein